MLTVGVSRSDEKVEGRQRRDAEAAEGRQRRDAGVAAALRLGSLASREL